MILINLHAHAECEEPSCGAKTPARIMLLSTGMLGAELDSNDWQAGYVKPGAAWLTLCPKHAQKVVRPPEGIIQAPSSH
jgi:hypothetical protein